jgi:hypothetical protein
VLANVKNSLVATHCVVGAKHLPRYLGAFAWRFNSRFVLKTIHERLAIAATTTPPMPYRLFFKLAEARWQAGQIFSRIKGRAGASPTGRTLKASASHLDIPKRYQRTRSKPLLSRQQYPRDNDREQIARARHAAEALFTSKPLVTKTAVTEAASPSPTDRKPRVLQIIARPAKRDEEVKAAATPEQRPTPQPAVAIHPHPLVGKVRHDGSPGRRALRRRDR